MERKAFNIIASAKNTIATEAAALNSMSNFLDDRFEKVVKLISECTGRLVLSGIGKSAIVAQKIVSTLNSTGTPSIFLHAADAIHGDLGMIQNNDIVIVFSKSGDSPEIKVLVPLIKNFGNKVIAMTGNSNGFLAGQADGILDTTVSEEACPNNLAPTTSTTAQMVMGDALAICLMEMKGFNSDDFAKFHPGGTLGKKLYLRVAELFPKNEKPQVQLNATIRNVIIEITKKRLGATVVTDNNQQVVGIITDGDIRRMLQNHEDTTGILARDIMSPGPKTVESDALAVNALDLMRKNNITQLIVTEGGQYAGIVHLHDLIREGLI